MMKRMLALALMLCMLLSTAAVPASADGPTFSNLDELLSYLYYDCAYMLVDEINFSYTSNLDYLFSTPDPLRTMLFNCGLLDWTQYRNTDKRTVRIEGIQYYQGFKIAQAWEIEMLELLNSEERTALKRAEDIVENVMQSSNNKLDVMYKLHDYLVRTVTYESNDGIEGWDYRDTAIGALNYGRAECDGYSDAFFLLCTLSDIPVGFQYGTTDDTEGDGTHLWNLVFWEGWYYQMDVTWDDKDRKDASDMATYRYFGVGSSMMEDHYWDPELSLYDQALYNNWDIFFYTCDKTGANGGAYYATMKDAANYAVYMQKNYSYDSLHIMVDGRYDDGKYFNDVLQDAGLRGQWTTWSKKMGEYTCFDILFVD